MAVPVTTFIEMPIKSVALRATTATRAGCVQRGLGRNMLSKARQQKCCQRWPMTQYTLAEYQGPHFKQDHHDMIGQLA